MTNCDAKLDYQIIDDEIQQKIKHFTYYLVESIENNLQFWLKVLEGTGKGNTPSTIMSAINSIFGLVPYAGKGIETALKESEVYMMNKVDEKNSRKLADLVYYYNDNKTKVRNTLINAAIEIFCCYDKQFCELDCEGGSPRAMQKLAKDASKRILNYLMEKKQDSTITQDDLTKGLIYGSSLKNSVGIQKGRTLKNDEHTWTTFKIFRKTGLFHVATSKCYQNDDTKVEKYGYRRNFAWELPDEILEQWTMVEEEHIPIFNIKLPINLEELSNSVSLYILEKSAEGRTKIHQDEVCEVLLEDHQGKHNELLEKFDMIIEFNRIRIEKESEMHENLKSGLETVQVVVKETHQTNVELKNTVTEIQNKQEETSSVVTEIMKKVCEMPGPRVINLDVQSERITKEVERSGKKIEKEAKRFGKKVKKLF